MTNVEPSFVLYALLLDPGCCLRAHIILIELVEPEEKKRKKHPRWNTMEQGHPLRQDLALGGRALLSAALCSQQPSVAPPSVMGAHPRAQTTIRGEGEGEGVVHSFTAALLRRSLHTNMGECPWRGGGADNCPSLHPNRGCCAVGVCAFCHKMQPCLSAHLRHSSTGMSAFVADLSASDDGTTLERQGRTLQVGSSQQLMDADIGNEQSTSSNCSPRPAGNCLTLFYPYTVIPQIRVSCR